MPLEAEIKAEALKLGFVVSGIARPAQPQTFPSYQSWIAENCHAGMAYLARPESLNARADPEKAPGSRSIICVGLFYPPPETPSLTPKLVRATSLAYALQPDYHDVMTAKLKQLGQRLTELVGRPVSFRAQV